MNRCFLAWARPAFSMPACSFESIRFRIAYTQKQTSPLEQREGSWNFCSVTGLENDFRLCTAPPLVFVGARRRIGQSSHPVDLRHEPEGVGDLNDELCARL